MWMIMAPDAAQLNNFENDLVKSFKDAAKRTRQHDGTMIGKLQAALDRLTAVKMELAKERHD